MKRIKNRIKDQLKYWLNKCNARPASLVITEFLTLMLLGVVSLLLFATCKQQQVKDIPMDTGAGDIEHVAHYLRPEMPQMMIDPQERASFYVRHYWDRYFLADTAFIHSADTEQLFADFLDALKYAGPKESASALKTMMSRMETDSTAYAHFCFLSEKYLYHPNSPVRNDEYYIPVLEQIVHSGRLTDIEKSRPADRLKQAHKNRPGMTATDFTYITPLKMDNIQRMSSIKADYTLLFFYDPDCSNCREYEKVLSEIPSFVEMQENGELRVLAVYPDEDKDEWLVNSSKLPKGWIVGWNKQGDIRSKTLYEIRATPTLYLLDKQKKVILKDASLERIIEHLAAVYPGQSNEV